MTPHHNDALLGGTWTWDPEKDDVFVQDAPDEMQELLRDLVDTLDD